MTNPTAANVVGFQESPARDETSLSDRQESSIRRVANDLHRLNEAIQKAVENGVTVELMRASRFHGENGAYGDQMIPIITR